LHNRNAFIIYLNAGNFHFCFNPKIEIFFRKVRRNIRKRCGNIATSNVLSQSDEKLALFQNMGIEKYREIVFGSCDVSAVFARHRKPFRKDGMTRKRIIELVDKGTEMIIQGTLHDDPYSDEVMDMAYQSRNDQATSPTDAWFKKDFN
jgi:hypothetical protein